MGSEPFFPVELEQLIFTAAFDPDDLASNVNMTLVARRVREWIRPLLCRIVFQCHTFISTSSGAPASQFPNFRKHWRTCSITDIGPFVKHVLLESESYEYTEDPKYNDTTSFVNDLLQHCPNLENLANWQEDGLPEEIFSLLLGDTSKLRRYSDTSRGSDDNPRSRDIWFSPGFKGLTHLDLMDCTVDWPFEALSFYTHLTHFSAVLPHGWNDSTLQSVLSFASSLKVFIIGLRKTHQECLVVLNHQQMVRTIGDARIVLLDAVSLDNNDWLEGAKGRFNSWKFAERVIEAREDRFFKREADHWALFAISFEWETNLTTEGMQWYASWR